MKPITEPPKPNVPCKRCHSLFKRATRFTKLCDRCWNKAQQMRLRKIKETKNRNIYKSKRLKDIN